MSIGKHAKRVIKCVGGFGLLIAGIILLPLPGPGWAIIFLGLAVLATEFDWARRLLDKLKERAQRLRDAAFGSSKKDKVPPR